MINLISWLQSIIIFYGYKGVLIASFLEEVVWFVPSSIIQTSFGFFLLQNTSISFESISYLFVHIAIPGAVGATLGTLPFYLISFYGGNYLFIKYKRYINLPENFTKYTTHTILQKKNFTSKALFISRIIPFIPSTTTTIVFGLIGLPPKKYFLYTLIGMFVRVSFFSFIGWQLGLGYLQSISKLGEIVTSYIIAVSIIVFFVWLYIKNIKNKI